MATVAKVRRRYWIVRAHSLAKSVIKHECVFCKKSQAQCETKMMADLPEIRLVRTLHHFTTQRAIILALVTSRLGAIKVRNITE